MPVQFVFMACARKFEDAHFGCSLLMRRFHKMKFLNNRLYHFRYYCILCSGGGALPMDTKMIKIQM